MRVEASAAVLARWPDPWSAVTRVERDRARSFHGADEARDFLAAHLLARECVAAVTGADVVVIEQHCAHCGGPHGKPFVPADPDVGVSWSHSRGHVAAAAARGPVGVDVEVRSRPHDVQRLARRMATPAEAAAILADDDPDGAYLRMWVVKEALVKIGAITLAAFGRTDVRAGSYDGITLTVTDRPDLVVGLAARG